MHKFTAWFVCSTLVLSLTACDTVSKQGIGAATGGVLGGIAGSQIGGGNGRTVAIIGATLAGALLGGAVGKSMDDVDKMKLNQSLETGPTNQTSTWQNPDNGNSYQVTPTQTYVNNQGRPCRRYTMVGYINGAKQYIHGTACRMNNGTWKAVN